MSDETRKFLEELRASSEIPPAPFDIGLTRASATKVKTEIDVTSDPHIGEDEGQLTIDVYNKGGDVIVESPIAGVDPEDIDVVITADGITIRGKREREHDVRHEDYVYHECYWGKFARSVSLPEEVDPEGAEATIKNGVLKIKLPKRNRAKARKLEIKNQ
ncbi:MAG: Hsp20/alpha crystallin family protein [Patescibacteria group bacterium]